MPSGRDLPGDRRGARAVSALRPDGLPAGLLQTPGSFDRERLTVAAPQAAKVLLGALLVRTMSTGEQVVARIVETEAYREDDPASHSYVGNTARTAPMFERPGTAYVYRSYGVHWCCNVTVEEPGIGAAVLLRAAAVLRGIEVVRERRRPASDRALLRGPGNLAAGLDLDAACHDGGDLVAGTAGLRLADDGWRPDDDQIVVGPRVGISQAAEVPWRFHLRGVPEVSAYRRSPRADRRARG